MASTSTRSQPQQPQRLSDMYLRPEQLSEQQKRQQLLTPEEPFIHSFTSKSTSNTLPPYRRPDETPPSPVSPAFQTLQYGAVAESNHSTQDPPLYPDHNLAIESQRPLFTSSYTGAQHDSYSTTPTPVASPPQQPQQVQQPQPQQRFRSFLSAPERFNQDRHGYYRSCISEIDDIKQAQRALYELPAPQARPSTLDPVSSDQLDRLDSLHKVRGARNTRVTKPTPAAFNETTRASPPQARLVRETRNNSISYAADTTVPAKLARPTTPAAAAAASKKRTASASKHSRKISSTPSNGGAGPDSTTTPTSTNKARTRAPATKKNDGPDPSSWSSVPDFCPPTSTLDGAGVRLLDPSWREHDKEGRDKAIDLSLDRNRGHLHDKEVELAEVLRVPCDKYMLCKRLIFQAKAKAFVDARSGGAVGKDGKGGVSGGEFNKTAAQQSCPIDVNKASRLWHAFNSVGWFEERWFEQYL